MTRVFVGVVVGGLLTACTQSNLNDPCPLIKKGADGGRIVLTEEEVQQAQGNNDFISTGSVECDDLYCVRDRWFDPKGAALSSPALGYCSRHCQQGEVCASKDSKMDKGTTRLVCRPLLLNTETLANTHLAGVTDPYFCARGGADGG